MRSKERRNKEKRKIEQMNRGRGVGEKGNVCDMCVLLSYLVLICAIHIAILDIMNNSNKYTNLLF